jgi:hypothetical protein
MLGSLNRASTIFSSISGPRLVMIPLFPVLIDVLMTSLTGVALTVTISGKKSLPVVNISLSFAVTTQALIKINFWLLDER